MSESEKYWYPGLDEYVIDIDYDEKLIGLLVHPTTASKLMKNMSLPGIKIFSSLENPGTSGFDADGGFWSASPCYTIVDFKRETNGIRWIKIVSHDGRDVGWTDQLYRLYVEDKQLAPDYRYR